MKILYLINTETYIIVLHVHKQKLTQKDSYLEITRYGKKLFTIVILDKDLNIIGEKLFPEFTYVPTAHLIRKDGLYISCSHFKNPNYSDDVLCFQKIKLISNL